LAETCLAAVTASKSVAASVRVRVEFLRVWLAGTDPKAPEPPLVSTKSTASASGTTASDAPQESAGPLPLQPPPPPPPPPPSKPDAAAVAAACLWRRVDALKAAERALQASRRLGDPELTQEGCVLVFNLARPLLAPALRPHVQRPLAAAAAVLDALGTPLLPRLQAALHLEAAKGDAGAGFVESATAHANAALAADYGSIEGSDGGVSGTLTLPRTPSAEERQRQEALNDVLRPLDRFIAPL
ncbi:unnamed protein product, partial [Phaeothamnion confervicola]